MKCVHHNTTDAVSTCPDCGVGLCKPCTSVFSIPICARCNVARIDNDERELNESFKLTRLAMLVAIVLFGLLCVLLISGQISFNSFVTSSFFAAMVAGIPAGRDFINTRFPRRYMGRTISEDFHLRSLRAVSYVMAGIVVAPFFLKNYAKRKKQIAALRSESDQLLAQTAKSGG
jgi:hypothetical protein